MVADPDFAASGLFPIAPAGTHVIADPHRRLVDDRRHHRVEVAGRRQMMLAAGAAGRVADATRVIREGPEDPGGDRTMTALLRPGPRCQALPMGALRYLGPHST